MCVCVRNESEKEGSIEKNLANVNQNKMLPNSIFIAISVAAAFATPHSERQMFSLFFFCVVVVCDWNGF